MKSLFLALLGILTLIGLDRLPRYMRDSGQAAICFNAEAGGYFPPLITYRCELVSRKKLFIWESK